MDKILIIDDEIGICTSLSIALEDEYEVKATVNVMEAMAMIKEESFDICLLDLRIGEYDGLDVLEMIKSLDNDVMVIMMTAFFSVETTVEAMRKGAYTYITKPINIEGLKIIIKQTMEYKMLNAKVKYLTRELNERYDHNGIIGNSPQMKQVYEYIKKLRNVDTNVVILGESGTGKEMVAKAIHGSGKRKDNNFVEINCAAIPEGMLEEEMFGHKKGSFTGATEDKIGKFEYADNGTIFFDEIGEMSLSLQSKLLRVLQEKEVTPLGSNEKKKINVRVICATNRNLREMVNEGTFRKDLFFRLNVMEIALPPLREKKRDIKPLINYFIEQYNKEMGKNIIGLTSGAEQLLMKYNYPGNVRELSNAIEYAMVLTDEDYIEISALPNEIRTFEGGNTNGNIFSENLVGLTMKEIEKKVISETLTRNNGSRKKSAEMLGISEKGLRNKIHEYEIEI